jgi:hypothetical protein
MKNILAISLVIFSTLAFADNHGEESSISSTFSDWWDKTKELGSAIWSETKESTAETAEKVEKSDTYQSAKTKGGEIVDKVQNSETYQSIKTESSNLYEKAKQQFSSEPRTEPAPVK